MREIKFRGKRVDNGDFVYGDLSQDKAGDMFKVNGFIVYRETVGQYTGLHDENGREIYEGDIRKLPNGDMCVVKYFDKYTRFAFSTNNDSNILPMRITDMTNTEYLGTIHDNPDLLKGA